MTHTLGPWIAVMNLIGNPNRDQRIISRDGIVAEVPGKSENARANASLIIAAPDMYKALAALVQAHDERPRTLTDAEWNEARAALFLAENYQK